MPAAPFEDTAPAAGASAERVGAVIVTYFAEPDATRRLLAAILPQVSLAVVVDNTPAEQAPRPAPADGTDVAWLSNGANLGLAAAHNQGIAQAAARGCTHVVLFDQDSLPAADMVEQLLGALRDLTARGIRAGAVGPAWRDRHSARSAPFVRLGWGRMQPAGPGDVVECDTLVSSGSLIPLSVIDAVGAMDEALFIDQVDTEWGLRAQGHGYRLFGVNSAVLTHGIGEHFVRPWFARGRTIPVHAPVRDYYLVRNTIEVFFRRPAPWRWRLLQMVRLPGLVVAMLTQMPPRAQRLRLIARAVVDGLRRRLGPCPAASHSRPR